MNRVPEAKVGFAALGTKEMVGNFHFPPDAANTDDSLGITRSLLTPSGLTSLAAAQGSLNSALTFIPDHASLISASPGINSRVAA